MERERFHIGQSSVGNESMGPHEATVTWINDRGHEVTADLGEAELEQKVAQRRARAGDPSVFVEALSGLRKFPNRRP